jgi:hypothetical protein
VYRPCKTESELEEVYTKIVKILSKGIADIERKRKGEELVDNPDFLEIV